ncbi:hypothetical protein [Rossellomorea vietnamensis]|uniref:hypothetical protein n=1 Tax=Rossellomorea vietnamensis TaxID=218284 RepID=UPI00077C691F|nr:hypothetical protein [Rossellomorea vietnamensis]
MFYYLDEQALNRTPEELFKIIYSQETLSSLIAGKRKRKNKRTISDLNKYIEECKLLYKIKSGYEYSLAHYSWYINDLEIVPKKVREYSSTRGAMLVERGRGRTAESGSKIIDYNNLRKI